MHTIFRSIAKVMREKAGRSIIQGGFSENLTLRNKELNDFFEYREITMKEKCKEENKKSEYVDSKKVGVNFIYENQYYISKKLMLVQNCPL